MRPKNWRQDSLQIKCLNGDRILKSVSTLRRMTHDRPKLGTEYRVRHQIDFFFWKKVLRRKSVANSVTILQNRDGNNFRPRFPSQNDLFLVVRFNYCIKFIKVVNVYKLISLRISIQNHGKMPMKEDLKWMCQKAYEQR